MAKPISRLAKALLREGVRVEQEGPIYRVRRADSLGPEAEVLLPPDYPLEAKAVKQLVAFASAADPRGGHVCRACATPDFHPGDLVPVGAVIATTPNMAIPDSIGTDINCGMRMHATGIPLETFLSRKEELVRLLRGDLLLGSRDLPMTLHSMRAMFDEGLPAWLECVKQRPLGMLVDSDFDQLELERTLGFVGSTRWVPEVVDDRRQEIVRDDALGTVGSGNHFVEFQVVDQIEDGQRAFAWGLKTHEVAFMVHTGSRFVGKAVGVRWADLAKKRWPKGVKYPEIFTVHGPDVDDYIEAMNTAANYGAVNRSLIAEIVRRRLRQVFGDLEVPLVHDAPHNLVFRENDLLIHRKGATPAHEGQPVLIPGSMGHPSHVLVGLGNSRFLSSASHGAGRALTRFEMSRKARGEEDLGLEGIECITLREERRIEEAPAAYKDIGPVIQVQVEQMIAQSVAVTKPIVTFKA